MFEVIAKQSSPLGSMCKMPPQLQSWLLGVWEGRAGSTAVLPEPPARIVCTSTGCCRKSRLTNTDLWVCPVTAELRGNAEEPVTRELQHQKAE